MTLRFLLLSIVLVCSLAGVAIAQPLPYLQAALAALQQGHIDETQKDLEQAKMQLLASHAGDDPAVTRVTLALKALAEKNRPECARMIEEAMRWLVPADDNSWHQRAGRDSPHTFSDARR